MDEKCLNCPARDICGGNVGELIEGLAHKYAAILAILAVDSIMASSVKDSMEAVLFAFTHGYIARAVETAAEYTETPDLDMDVWGQCME